MMTHTGANISFVTPYFSINEPSTLREFTCREKEEEEEGEKEVATVCEGGVRVST